MLNVGIPERVSESIDEEIDRTIDVAGDSGVVGTVKRLRIPSRGKSDKPDEAQYGNIMHDPSAAFTSEVRAPLCIVIIFSTE